MGDMDGLSASMKASLKHGIGGAKRSTLDALARRGLVGDAPEKPGFLKLTERGESVRMILLHPLKPGRAGTDPESDVCPHGKPGQWHRWEWNEKTGSEEESEPVILDVPIGCHECNCDDPHCETCYNYD